MMSEPVGDAWAPWRAFEKPIPSSRTTSMCASAGSCRSINRSVPIADAIR
jgi:hypothetical protein